MSTKIYNGRVRRGTSVSAWQHAMDTAREALKDWPDQVAHDFVIREAINIHDARAMDLPVAPKPGDPWRSPLGFAVDRLQHKVKAAETLRDPLVDTEINVSWRFRGRNVYCILFCENREKRKVVEEILKLEDYHYQNQSDSDIPYREMQRRGARWNELLGPTMTPRDRLADSQICPPINYRQFYRDYPSTGLVEQTDDQVQGRTDARLSLCNDLRVPFEPVKTVTWEDLRRRPEVKP